MVKYTIDKFVVARTFVNWEIISNVDYLAQKEGNATCVIGYVRLHSKYVKYLESYLL